MRTSAVGVILMPADIGRAPVPLLVRHADIISFVLDRVPEAVRR